MKYENIYAACQRETCRESEEQREIIKSTQNPEDLAFYLAGSQVSDPMRYAREIGIEKAREISLKCVDNDDEEKLLSYACMLERIETTRIPNTIQITMERDGKTTTASVEIDGNGFFDGAAGESEYGEESIAAGKALNSALPILRILCDKEEERLAEHPGRDRDTYFGCGCGRKAVPSFSTNGVGTFLFGQIFRNLGYNWRTVAQGKRFIVYAVTKKMENAAHALSHKERIWSMYFFERNRNIECLERAADALQDAYEAECILESLRKQQKC